MTRDQISSSSLSCMWYADMKPRTSVVLCCQMDKLRRTEPQKILGKLFWTLILFNINPILTLGIANHIRKHISCCHFLDSARFFFKTQLGQELTRKLSLASAVWLRVPIWAPQCFVLPPSQQLSVCWDCLYFSLFSDREATFRLPDSVSFLRCSA